MEFTNASNARSLEDVDVAIGSRSTVEAAAADSGETAAATAPVAKAVVKTLSPQSQGMGKSYGGELIGVAKKIRFDMLLE